MVVFRVELLIFEADSEYELENIDFQNFWFFFFFPLTHTVHLLTCGIEAARDDDREISSFLASKAIRILISIK